MINRIKTYLGSISADAWAVCVYFLCLPFTVVTTPVGSLLKVMTMPVVAVLAYKLLIGKRKPLAFNSVQLVYSLFLVYVIFGMFWFRSETAMVHTKDMLLAYFVMILMSMRGYNEKERDIIETSWILVGIICTALCLTSTQVANEFENRTIVYVLGFPEDPNQFCAYFIMPVMVCMKRIVEKRKTTPLYMLLAILIVYSVLRTGSRGGFIGIMMGVFVCIMIAVKSFKAKALITLAVIFCAVIVATVVFPMLPEDVQARYSVDSVVADSGAGRFDIWKYLVQYTIDSPVRLIRGSGLLSTYEILDGANVPVSAGAAHNQFVQVLCDQGILGMLLFVALIMVCFFRNVRKNPFYACAFVAVMAFSMSLTLYVFKPYINIIIMCAMNFAKTPCAKGAEDENDKRTLEKEL